MSTAEMLCIKVSRHPLARKFKTAGLRQVDVARHCGCSLSYMSHIIAGYRPAPEWLEEKLQELSAKIDELEAAS